MIASQPLLLCGISVVDMIAMCPAGSLLPEAEGGGPNTKARFQPKLHPTKCNG